MKARTLKDILSLRRHAEEATSDLPALMAAAQRAVSSVLHGEHRQRKAGSGERFWQFREYQPGDRPQDIDWRQSGKTDRVFIRQKEWQTTQTTIFWCSQSESMDFTSGASEFTKAQSAKILTLGLSLLLTKSGEQIGLYGQGRRGRSLAMIDHMGNALCDETADTQALPDFTQTKLPRHASFIQIGDFLEPIETIEAAFKNFSYETENAVVIQVLDPAELELPYDGRAVFEEPSNDTREDINHVASIRGEYQARIEAHIRAVEKACALHGWEYFLHRTDSAIADTLSLIWARMMRYEGAA